MHGRIILGAAAMALLAACGGEKSTAVSGNALAENMAAANAAAALQMPLGAEDNMTVNGTATASTPMVDQTANASAGMTNHAPTAAPGNRGTNSGTTSGTPQ